MHTHTLGLEMSGPDVIGKCDATMHAMKEFKGEHPRKVTFSPKLEVIHSNSDKLMSSKTCPK